MRRQLAQRELAPDLPEQAVVNILQRIPQQQRLTSCALVSRAWAAAASAATTTVSISADNCNEDTLQALSAWLKQHAGQVDSITVPKPDRYYQQSLRLPCSTLTKLRSLSLCNFSPALEGSSSSSDDSRQLPVLQVILPALQSLTLAHCILCMDGPPSALQLPQLTCLDACDVSMVEIGGWSMYGRREPGAGVSSLLQRLPQLLVLRLSRQSISDDALEAALRRLRHLQACSIQECPKVTPGVLAGLSTALTALSFASAPFDDAEVFCVDDVPAAGWPRLSSVAVYGTPLTPALLAGLTALTELDLQECPLLPTAEQVPEVFGYEQDAAGAEELLSALAQLTCLKSLELYEINLQAIDDLRRAAHHAQHDGPFHIPATNNHLQQFLALVASDQLQRLVLAYRDERQLPQVQPLPRYVFTQVLFPPGRQLLGLTEVVLDTMHPDVVESFAQFVLDGDSSENEDEDEEEEEEEEAGFEARERCDPFLGFWCIDSWDVNALAAACPNLRRLTLNCVTAPEDAEGLVASMLRLPERVQLELLCLGGPCLNNYTAAALAQMTSLRSLKLLNSPALRAHGLQQLTALEGLEHLEVGGCGYLHSIDFLLEEEAEAPEVWRQLAQVTRELRECQEEEQVQDWEVDSASLHRLARDAVDGFESAWWGEAP